jgi:hypothetical protein
MEIKCQSPCPPFVLCAGCATLIGWLAHVDEYCHVERHRSWTGIKLASPMRRRRVRPGCPGWARLPSRRTLTSGGTRSPPHRQELAPGARTAGPRGSRARGDGRPGVGHGRAGTPTGPESRTGVSRPGNHTWLGQGTPGAHTSPAPGRPGYATRKAAPPRKQAGQGSALHPARSRVGGQPPRHFGGSGHGPGAGTSTGPGTWNAWRKARPDGSAHAR